MEKQKRGEGHVCKLCGQSCLNGKVLGGHMRSHAFKNQVKSERKLKEKTSLGFQDDDNVGYGLRSNPKKSRKFSGEEEDEEDDDDDDEIVCKVCGKVFDKKSALFGHMRHHSVKERIQRNDKDAETKWCGDCGKGFVSLKALGAHKRVHSRRMKGFDEAESNVIWIESLGMVKRRKRSARNRYRVGNSPSSSSFSDLNLNEFKFGCGGGYGVEIEEAAFCLMMISRGLGSWGQICSVAESSNTELDVLVSQKKRVRDNEAYDDEAGSSQIKRAKVQMLDDCENGSSVKEESEFGEVDSGYAVYGIETEKEEELGVEITEEVEMGLSVLGSMKFGLSKNAVLKACDSVNKVVCANESETFADSENKRKHKCRICSKVFGTHQALGGHQRVHKRSEKCTMPMIEDDHEDGTQIDTFCENEDDDSNPATLESSENSVEQEVERVSKAVSERKVHSCGICLKVFASGQALGGHKRVHYVRDTEIGTDQTRVMKQRISDIFDALELTHPIKLQEENDDAEFKPWWVGNEQKPELLMCLIQN